MEPAGCFALPAMRCVVLVDNWLCCLKEHLEDSMVWITRKKPGARARRGCVCPVLVCWRIVMAASGCCLWYEYRLALCFGVARQIF